MISLYTPEQAAFWHRRSVRSRYAACVLFCAALLGAVVLCCFVTTRNALTLQWIAVAEFALLGWIGIMLTVLVYLPARAEAQHTNSILSGAAETRTGTLTLSDQTFRIPKSIIVRRAALQTQKESLTVNVDNARAGLLPAGPFQAEVQTVRKYVSAFRPLIAAEEAAAPARSRSSLLSRFFSLVPGLILWGMFSMLLWCWVFSLITDTAPEKKISLYIDGTVSRSVELAAVLEENLPEGIRMVRVHPFTYAMMDSESIRRADLFILPEQDIGVYREWLAPLPDAFGSDWQSLLVRDSVPLGIRVYDSEAGLCAAGSCISYSESGFPDQVWYLCFGNQSLHTPGIPGALDSAAVPVAEALVRLR